MNKKIVNTTFWNITDKIVLFFRGTVVSIVLARNLGAEDYGMYSYIIAMAGFLTVFAKAGLENITTKDFSILKENRINYLYASIGIGSIGIIASLFLMMVCQIIVGKLDATVNILMGVFLISHVFEIFRYYLTAIYKIQNLMIVKMTIYMVMILAYIIGVICRKKLLYFNIVYFIGESLLLSMAFFLAIKYVRGWNEKINLEKMFEIFSHLGKVCIPLVFSGLSVSIYMRIDQFMIKGILDNTQLGIYSAAVKIAEGWYFVPTAICSSLLPYFTRLYYEDEDKFLDNYERFYCCLTSFAWLIALVISVLSKYIINILYGNEYADSAMVVTLYVWAGIFVCMGCARGIYLSIMEYSVYSFLFSFVSAVTNCIANAILIPRIGIIGATIATIISQIFQAFLGTYMIRKLKPIHKIQLKSLFGFLFIKEDLKNMVSLLRTLIDGKIHKKN